MQLDRVLIAGGAGFIGSHLCETLLSRESTERLTVFDNFSSGRRWHLDAVRGDRRLEVIEGDLKHPDGLPGVLEGHQTVVHLASNPDIARAATEPDIDFREGTVLTQNLLEGMRKSGVRGLLYASGSGVYGDRGNEAAKEDDGPLHPISTYGASKLAGESLISAYCHMFDFEARAFRFANVVGGRQTHGVGFDFVRKLTADPSRLEVLGDGTQSKSYIDVDDVIAAVLLAAESEGGVFEVFNVATGDYITVREIAELVIAELGLDSNRVDLCFAAGDRGWRGDVPIVRLDTGKIRALGWVCRRSAAEAISASVAAIAGDVQQGRVPALASRRAP